MKSVAPTLSLFFGLFILGSFFAVGSPKGALIGVFLYPIFFFLFPKEIRDLPDTDEDFVVFFITGICLMVFFTAPIWDSEAYCSMQTNGSIYGETWVESGESICNTRGSWEWMNGIEKMLLVVCTVWGLVSLGVIIYLNIVRWKDSSNYESSSEEELLKEHVNLQKIEQEEAINFLENLKRNKYDSKGILTLSLNRVEKFARDYDSTEPLFSLFMRVTLKDFSWEGDDGSYCFPMPGTYSTDERRSEIFKLLSNIDYSVDSLLEEKLKKSMTTYISSSDLKTNYKDWNIYSSEYLRDILYIGNCPEVFCYNYQVNKTQSEKIYKEFNTLINKERLKDLQEFFEVLRSQQITKLEKKIEKIREKEKVTATNLEVYLRLSQLLLIDFNPHFQKKAIELLKEISDRCSSELKLSSRKKEVLRDIDSFIEVLN